MRFGLIFENYKQIQEMLNNFHKKEGCSKRYARCPQFQDLENRFKTC